jgi:hypothetical protein
VKEIPPPPDGPPPGQYGPPPGQYVQPANPFAAPSEHPAPWSPARGEQFPQQPGTVTYGVAPKNRRFVWREALVGAFAGIAGNVLIVALWGGSGDPTGPVLLVFNAGWVIVPLVFKRWSYTVGYLVGVVGAVAVGLVVLIYSCSSTYGNSGG